MRGITQPLWPVRYKPMPDELLSSWLMRLAHGHGLKVQTFCNLVFGNKRQVWNRDIDRLGPPWLVEMLADATGTPLEQAWGTTLRGFEGQLFRAFKASGHLPWIQTLQMYHRKREGFGQQFCPLCLASTDPAYFRRSWRITFKTVCLAHGVSLQDRCPACQRAVAFHRVEMGKTDEERAPSMRHCHACGFDLAQSPTSPPVPFESQEALAWLCGLIQELDTLPSQPDAELDIGDLTVYRYLTSLLASKRGMGLNKLTAAEIGTDPIAFRHDRRLSIEGMPLAQRHQLLMQAGWLMLDPAHRIVSAWQAKAIRYNQLIKDFDDMPNWYRSQVIDLIDRRPYTHLKQRAPKLC
jgi:hypothetical protein